MKTILTAKSQNSLLQIFDPERFRHSRSDAVLAFIPEGEIQRLGLLFANQDPWARLGVKPEQLTAYFSQHDNFAPRYAIRVAHQFVGVVGLRIQWLKGPYLQFLGLHPNFQNLGLGSATLSWLIEEARRHNEPNVWVCASSFNHKALSFYEKKGFVRVAHLEGLVAENEDEILLRLRL